MALPFGKKIIFIIKRHNVKTGWCFHCLNCLHSSTTKSKLESHKRLYENKDLHL